MAATEPVTNLHGISLPPGYEIRRLRPSIEPLVRAFGTYNLQYGIQLHPTNRSLQGAARRVLLDFAGPRPTPSMHSVAAGLSFAVFDRNYRFRRPENEGEGRVYWDELDPEDPRLDDDGGEVGRRLLLEGLDSGLASLAFAHDGSDAYPGGVLEGLFGYMPEMQVLLKIFAQKKAEAQKATSSSLPAPQPEEIGTVETSGTVDPGDFFKNTAVKVRGERLARGGTGTLPAYQGRGLMKMLAHFLMHEAKARGFKSIEIGCTSEKVHHVWTNPPPPYRAEVVFCFDPRVEEMVDEEGRTVRPFRDAPLRLASSVVVHLS